MNAVWAELVGQTCVRAVVDGVTYTASRPVCGHAPLSLVG
jgi:hypothetical protein